MHLECVHIEWHIFYLLVRSNLKTLQITTVECVYNIQLHIFYIFIYYNSLKAVWMAAVDSLSMASN